MLCCDSEEYPAEYDSLKSKYKLHEVQITGSTDEQYKSVHVQHVHVPAPAHLITAPVQETTGAVAPAWLTSGTCWC